MDETHENDSLIRRSVSFKSKFQSDISETSSITASFKQESKRNLLSEVNSSHVSLDEEVPFSNESTSFDSEIEADGSTSKGKISKEKSLNNSRKKYDRDNDSLDASVRSRQEHSRRKGKRYHVSNSNSEYSKRKGEDDSNRSNLKNNSEFGLISTGSKMKNERGGAEEDENDMSETMTGKSNEMSSSSIDEMEQNDTASRKESRMASFDDKSAKEMNKSPQKKDGKMREKSIRRLKEETDDDTLISSKNENKKDEQETTQNYQQKLSRPSILKPADNISRRSLKAPGNASRRSLLQHPANMSRRSLLQHPTNMSRQSLAKQPTNMSRRSLAKQPTNMSRRSLAKDPTNMSRQSLAKQPTNMSRRSLAKDPTNMSRRSLANPSNSNSKKNLSNESSNRSSRSIFKGAMKTSISTSQHPRLKDPINTSQHSNSKEANTASLSKESIDISPSKALMNTSQHSLSTDSSEVSNDHESVLLSTEPADEKKDTAKYEVENSLEKAPSTISTVTMIEKYSPKISKLDDFDETSTTHTTELSKIDSVKEDSDSSHSSDSSSRHDSPDLEEKPSIPLLSDQKQTSPTNKNKEDDDSFEYAENSSIISYRKETLTLNKKLMLLLVLIEMTLVGVCLGLLIPVNIPDEVKLENTNNTISNKVNSNRNTTAPSFYIDPNYTFHSKSPSISNSPSTIVLAQSSPVLPFAFNKTNDTTSTSPSFTNKNSSEFVSESKTAELAMSNPAPTPSFRTRIKGHDQDWDINIRNRQPSELVSLTPSPSSPQSLSTRATELKPSNQPLANNIQPPPTFVNSSLLYSLSPSPTYNNFVLISTSLSKVPLSTLSPVSMHTNDGMSEVKHRTHKYTDQL